MERVPVWKDSNHRFLQLLAENFWKSQFCLGLRTNEMNRSDNNWLHTFSDKKSTPAQITTRCCFKIKIDAKRQITHISKVILNICDLTIVKSIGHSFPCCANGQMFFHRIVFLSKNVFTEVTLMSSSFANVLFPLSKRPL